jgi:ubiquinone/menaquinone biosynthesis C-methylase UbiE/DNA-binding transcriptional ArsR family regulator
MIGIFGIDDLVGQLKAAAEPTRLRILTLLSAGELNVKDLTQILGQSQPRISRHLKLLTEAGLVERFRDGSFVYFTIAERSEGGELARRLVASLDPADRTLRRDRSRAEAVKQERERAGQTYFEAHAGDWDRIRALHVDESEVEAAILAALGKGPFKLLVDLGVGTGRILELLGDRYARGLGLDINPSMLSYARAKLARARIGTAEVRHGDIYNIPLDNGVADAAVVHQVLHFLSEPQAALAEAARVLKPGGRLLIVDFAPHALEFLRERHAHERLGFAAGQVKQWLAAAGLRLMSHQELDPGAGDDKLTVSLWLAERPAGAEPARRKDRKLEETG